MKTTKSPKRVLKTSLKVGLRSLPLYSHTCSPKKFTQPQLFACLALKEFLQCDYRKLAAVLEDSPNWTALIGLRQVPHFTTFQKAAQRLLLAPKARRLLESTIREAQKHRIIKKRISLAAIDTSGWESHHASDHYLRRRAKESKNQQKIKCQRFPKAALMCDTASHFILGIRTGRGPGSDMPYFRPVLESVLKIIPVETLAADAGFDAEHTHEYAREELGVRTLIPPTTGHPTKNKPRGYWRRKMAERLHQTRYTQRWQIETVNSMLKRLQGSALRARKAWSKYRELTLRAITHNILLLWIFQVFYRATPDPLRFGAATA